MTCLNFSLRCSKNARKWFKIEELGAILNEKQPSYLGNIARIAGIDGTNVSDKIRKKTSTRIAVSLYDYFLTLNKNIYDNKSNFSSEKIP